MSICTEDNKKRYAPSVTESIYTSKSSCNLQRRKYFLNPNNNLVKPKNCVSEIILSAREKRLKHIRSQLTDANFKLTELCKENNILKCIKKRHEAALQRYESVNGDIPKLITNQTEEVKSWQTKYKELKKRYREASQLLNKKNIQFNKLSEDYEYLLGLCREENLGDLDEMQEEIQVLQRKLDKQQETIECLQRRLVMDEKAHKHKLILEKEKRREMAMSQHSDEQCGHFTITATVEERKVHKSESTLPTIQRNITNFKSMITEIKPLPQIPSYISKNTMIPRLNIPIPETDKESSDEKSYRTRTLTRRSDSCISDFYD